LAPHFDPQWMILLAALVIFGVIALIHHIHRSFPSNISSKPSEAKAKFGILTPLKNKYAVTLLLISMTGALAGLLIDFQFYAAAASARMGSKGNANFFANFYILLNFSSLLLQLFATPKIQDKVGLRGGLMVLPFALVGGATFATAAATAFSRSALRVTEGGLRSSVHRSIWEQAFIPVESSDRSSVKIAVDGIAARVAEALGALAILLWLKQVVPDGVIKMPLDTRWMSWVLLITVALWLFVTRRLKVEMKSEAASIKAVSSNGVDCERFPDQCPCTTELGKGIA
jgi:ATP/ADP translocase